MPTKQKAKQPGTPEQFNEFWRTYPKKADKIYCRKIWASLDFSDGLFEKMLTALAWQKHSRQWTKDDGDFIPNPSTWLNRGKWDDQPPEQNGRCELCGQTPRAHSGYGKPGQEPNSWGMYCTGRVLTGNPGGGQ